MFEAGSGDGEFQGVLVAGEVEYPVDEAAGETIAATHAVDDMGDVVVLAEEEFLAVVEAGGPAIVGGAVGFAQGHGKRFELGVGVENLVRKLLILRSVEFAGMDVDIELNAKGHLAVLFIGDPVVDELEEFRHHFLRGFSIFPEILTVVEIAGDSEAHGLGGGDAFQSEVRGGLAYSGRDAGDVEPACAIEGLLPIDVAGFGEGDGAVFAIVDDLGGPLVGAWFDEIDAEPAFSSNDRRGVDTEPAKFTNERIGDGVGGGKDGDVARGIAKTGEGDGDIRLSSTEGGEELRGLQKSLKARGCEAQHDFAEGNDRFTHRFKLYRRVNRGRKSWHNGEKEFVPVYHYDPSLALEELKDEALLPHPVKVRDMLLRSQLSPDQALELNRRFQLYLQHYGEAESAAATILEELARVARKA